MTPSDWGLPPRRRETASLSTRPNCRFQPTEQAWMLAKPNLVALVHTLSRNPGRDACRRGSKIHIAA